MTDVSTLSQQLAAFAVATVNTGAPAEVRSDVCSRILDIVGVQAAALKLDTSRSALAFVQAQGGSPQAHIVGFPDRVPATWAAFAGGVLAHSLDYDDTHLPSVLHPSASVVPAALAVAEMAGAPGARLVDAIAAGIEVVVRLGMTGYDLRTRNSVFFEHGQHATSICGALGSAVSAALLLDLGEAGIAHALGIAASMASGILEANRSGGTVKRLHCGWAAHAGVTAASMVEYGFTGPTSALEGRFGFFEAFLHDSGDQAVLTDQLGTRWEVPGIFYKPYPANHFTHTAIDAALWMRAQGLRPEDVDSATLGVASPTIRTIGQPLDVKRTPETGYQAQFSGPYAVAAGLHGGGGLGVGLDDFTDELAQDAGRRAVMQRVTVEADLECEASYPFQFPAVLTVRTADGSTMTKRVPVNRGGPENPLTPVELDRKFTENASRMFDSTTVRELADVVRRLDSLKDLGALTGALVGPGPSQPGSTR